MEYGENIDQTVLKNWDAAKLPVSTGEIQSEFTPDPDETKKASSYLQLLSQELKRNIAEYASPLIPWG